MCQLNWNVVCYKAGGLLDPPASAGPVARAITRSFRPLSRTSTWLLQNTSMTLLKCTFEHVVYLIMLNFKKLLFLYSVTNFILSLMNWSRGIRTRSPLSSTPSRKVKRLLIIVLIVSLISNSCLIVFAFPSHAEYGVRIAEFLKFKLMADPIMQNFYMALAEVSNAT